MEFLTLFIIAILAALAVILIIYPLWQQTRTEALFKVNRAGQTLEEYEARYQATLKSIKDLMFDYEMGKVAEEDYERLLSESKLEAANLRREIDRLSTTINIDTEIDTDLNDEIETLVAQTRQDANSHTNAALLNAIDAEIDLLKDVHLADDNINSQDKVGYTCPTCETPFHVGDGFCTGCGQSLAGLAEPETHVCPQCSRPVQPGDAFCAGCGQPMEPVKKPSAPANRSA